MKTHGPVLVTGAARGTGRAIATRLLRDGTHVIGTYLRGETEAHELLGQYPGLVEMHQVDLSSRDQTAALIQACAAKETLGGMVLNAGAIEFALLDETTDAQWDSVIEINLSANWLLLRGLGHLVAPGAAIVAISSTDATRASYASIGYTVSKAGLNALMNCAAAVLGVRQVRAIALCPGWMNTAMSTKESYEAASLTPLGRNGTPDEIAAVAVFLLSPHASFINGSPLVVDGGYGLVDYVMTKEAGGL